MSETVAHGIKGSDGTMQVCLGFEEALIKARKLAETFPAVRFELVELIERPASEAATGLCEECGNAGAPLNADGSIAPHGRLVGTEGFMVSRPCRGSVNGNDGRNG